MRAIWAAKTEQDMFDCVAWLYDGFPLPQKAGGCMTKHVAVLMGGWSAEREVSLRSGEACAEAAERAGYRVSRVDVGAMSRPCWTSSSPMWRSTAARPSGRGRHLQGILEILGIP